MTTENDTDHEKDLSSSSSLIIIRGIPGSGKSTLSRLLASQLKNNFGKKVTYIDPDENKYKGNSEKGTIPATKAELQLQAIMALGRGETVIWDQLLTSIDSAETILMLKKFIQPTRLLLVEITIPEEEAWRRVSKRQESGEQTGPSREQFDDYISRYRSLGSMNLENNLLIVHGDRDINENVKMILNNLGLS